MSDAQDWPAADDASADEFAVHDDFTVHDDSDEIREAHEAIEPAEAHDVDDLSSLRIRQVSASRRGVNTLRFYGIIGLLFVATELVDSGMRYRGAQRGRWVMFAGIILAAACFVPIGILLRRIVRTTREFKKSSIEPPEIPPDLAMLSDGSQHLKNLEALTQGPDTNETP